MFYDVVIKHLIILTMLQGNGYNEQVSEFTYFPITSPLTFCCLLTIKLSYKKTKNGLQKAVYQLSKICHEYNLKNSMTKTKIMAFKGKFTVLSKIVIDNKIIGQISHYSYLCLLYTSRCV